MNARKSSEDLERLFHEPTRIAIISELCTAGEGLAFTDLRDRAGLTDGNLSRHLTLLAESGVVKLQKEFVGAKPRTTVLLTDRGREQFLTYLDELAHVVRTAAQRASPARDRQSLLFALSKLKPAR